MSQRVRNRIRRGIFSRPYVAPVETPADYDPDPFVFAPVEDAVAGETYIASIEVNGISAASPTSISATGGSGEYRRNGGTWTSALGVVENLDDVDVRLVASEEPGEEVSATLTIGGVSATFTVTTAGAPDPGLTDVYGLTDTNLDRWKAARDSGVGGIVVVGPSTQLGIGASGIPGDSFTGVVRKSPTAKLAAWLNANGIPAKDGGFISASSNGVQTIAAFHALYNGDVAVTDAVDYPTDNNAKLKMVASSNTLGGRSLTMGRSWPGTITYTLRDCDEAVLMWACMGVSGTQQLQYQVDGGSWVTFATNSPNVRGFKSLAVNLGAVGDHVLSIRGGTRTWEVPWIGVLAWKTGVINLFNVGWSGSHSNEINATHASNLEYPGNAIQALLQTTKSGQPRFHLGIVGDMELNDRAVAPTQTAAQHQSNMTSYINKLKTYVDVLVVSGHDVASGDVTYANAQKAATEAAGVVWADARTHMGAYAGLNSGGRIFADGTGLHRTELYNTDWAAFVGPILDL